MTYIMLVQGELLELGSCTEGALSNASVDTRKEANARTGIRVNIAAAAIVCDMKPSSAFALIWEC